MKANFFKSKSVLITGGLGYLGKAICSELASNGCEVFLLDKLDDNKETITLKKPNEVYFKLWEEARIAAKKARKDAIAEYLNAKNIKATYMLDEIDDDGYDEFDNHLENLTNNQKETLSV